MLLCRPLQSRFDLFDLLWRCCDARLRLLLECVQDIHDLLEPDGVDRAVAFPVVIFHNLQDARAAESLQRLCAVVLAAHLGDIKRVPDLSDDLRREGEEILLCCPVAAGLTPSPLRRMADCATCSQLDRLWVAGSVPERKNVNRSSILVDGVDDPIVGSATDTEQVSAVWHSGEREVTPRQRRFLEIHLKNAAETLDLLDCEVLAVVAQVGGELIDLAQRDRAD